MKRNLTLSEIEEIALNTKATFTASYPAIEHMGFVFEFDGIGSGLYRLSLVRPCFEDELVDQMDYPQEVLNLMHQLSNKPDNRIYLTVDNVNQYMNKPIVVGYDDVNEGTMSIVITDVVEQPSNQMGQLTEKRLHVTEIADGWEHEHYYEWFGIFRRGSGAERLFIVEQNKTV